MIHYAFGPYRFDGASSLFEGPQGSVVIRPKTASLLCYLLEQSERFVTRQELLEVVWQATAVTPNVLYQSIKELRSLLGGKRLSQAYLISVRNHGYRWVWNDTQVQFEPFDKDSVPPDRLKLIEGSPMNATGNSLHLEPVLAG